MKICPTCQTAYDDEEMRFCIKDGVRLVENDTIASVEPLDDEPEAPTVVSTSPQFTPNAGGFNPPPPQRIVIPSESQNQVPPPNPAVAAPQPNVQPPQRKKSSVVPILLAVIGVLVLLGGALGIGGWYYLRNGNSTEVAQTNANQNANLNANTETDGNSSFPIFTDNTNAENTNLNSNLASNANLKSPTPTPKATPTATPKPTATPRSDNSNDDNGDDPPEPELTPTPFARPTAPIATPEPTRNVPTTVSSGVVNGKATNLPKPAYPAAARAVRASGAVNVQVLIDEQGNVLSANAVSGHPLLRQAAVSAARQAKFSPTVLSGQPVKVTGTIVYNFAAQ